MFHTRPSSRNPAWVARKGWVVVCVPFPLEPYWATCLRGYLAKVGGSKEPPLPLFSRHLLPIYRDKGLIPKRMWGFAGVDLSEMVRPPDMQLPRNMSTGYISTPHYSFPQKMNKVNRHPHHET